MITFNTYSVTNSYYMEFLKQIAIHFIICPTRNFIKIESCLSHYCNNKSLRIFFTTYEIPLNTKVNSDQILTQFTSNYQS